MRTDELDFRLPPELIAQEPPAQRTDSRLLHYVRSNRQISHHPFAELPSLLGSGDLLVFNDARVIPARFTLQKSSGGRIEGLFLDEPSEGHWHVLLKNLGRATDALLHFTDAPQITARVTQNLGAGEHLLTLEPPQKATALLDRIGRMPLPPYIKRQKDHDPRDQMDRTRYQTVFAKEGGAVAAPTAALHFSPELLRQLDDAGIRRTFVTLHVGMGTFKPVSSDTLEGHAMHVERYSISTEAAHELNRAQQEGRRIIAVGTTAARVLESQPADESFLAKADQTGIFIYPPYTWKHVNALITNFHLPRSTLIALVAALVGLEEQRRLYHIAIENRYRFFSYGDAMFVE